MSNYLIEPTPNEEAISFLARKRPLNAAAYKGLLPELRAYAFTVSGIGSASALQEVRDLVAEVPSGEDFRKTKKRVMEILAQHIPLEPDLFGDEEEAKKHRAALARRAEMVVRNNAFQAYSVSNYKELDEFRDIFTHWQYLTVGDGRVRASHAALNKVTLPQGHPFWRSHFPPWEFGCRCQVVGLTEEEAGEELEKSRKAKPEERWVLEGEELERLEKEGTIVRNIGGAPVRVNVTSGRERNEPGAWRWEPSDLAMTFADLKSRYDEQTFGMWEAWAKRVDAGQGQSVWDWVRRGLGGTPANGPRRPRVVPGPLPVPPRAVEVPDAVPAVPAPTGTALGTPVKGSLVPVAKMTKKERARVDAVMDAIGRVHGDGPLPKIPVAHSPGASAWGSFVTVRGQPHELHYRFKAPNSRWGVPHPETTLVHEIGHFLDYGGMPRGSALRATDNVLTDARLRVWWDRVQESEAWKTMLKTPMSFQASSYYQRTREAWARCYAQFIAEESGDAVMLEQIRAQVAGSHGFTQWTEEDFKPIREAMREYFRGLAWMI